MPNNFDYLRPFKADLGIKRINVEFSEQKQNCQRCTKLLVNHQIYFTIMTLINFRSALPTVFWMSAKRLTLNHKKTEFLWLSTSRRKHFSSRASFTLHDAVDAPTTATHNLGVPIDETLSFDSHISHPTWNCYYQLRRIKAICCYIPIAVVTQLTHVHLSFPELTTATVSYSFFQISS